MTTTYGESISSSLPGENITIGGFIYFFASYIYLFQQFWRQVSQQASSFAISYKENCSAFSLSILTQCVCSGHLALSRQGKVSSFEYLSIWLQFILKTYRILPPQNFLFMWALKRTVPRIHTAFPPHDDQKKQLNSLNQRMETNQKHLFHINILIQICRMRTSA